MLRKEIFLKHANEKIRSNVRRLIQPFPETEVMQNKLQVSADWKNFKNKVMLDASSTIQKRKLSAKSSCLFN
jgi:hypothetical protein